MPEWNSKNRIPIESVEKQKSFEIPKTKDKATFIYDESAKDFIESIKNNPEFKELGEKEIIELENEVKKASQEYKKKEQSIVAKRLGVIRKFIKEFIDTAKTSKTLQALITVLILESAFVGYDISTSLLKPEINLVYNAAKLAKNIKYEIKFDKEEKEIMSFLRGKIIQDEIDKICDLKNNEDEKDGEKEKIERKIPLIENIEGLGIKKDDMESILKTFPDSFIANINKIQYKAEKAEMSKSYGIKNKSIAEANRDTKELVFFESEKEFIESIKNYDELSSTIAHEMAHLNDWGLNSILSTKDRLSLYKAIIERVESKDRYNSYYVESISNKDKKIELSLKALEYFAIICNRYFNSPDLLPNKDKKIIEEMIEKTDPGFSQKKDEKNIERFAIIERMNDNIFYK